MEVVLCEIHLQNLDGPQVHAVVQLCAKWRVEGLGEQRDARDEEAADADRVLEAEHGGRSAVSAGSWRERLLTFAGSNNLKFNYPAIDVSLLEADGRLGDYSR